MLKNKLRKPISRISSFYFKRSCFGAVTLLAVVALTAASYGLENGVTLEGCCSVDTFTPNVRLFTNRNYVLSQSPKLLQGMQFVRTPIEGLSQQNSRLTCIEPGVIYALSPSPSHLRAASQEAALLAAGFEKLPQKEFMLFGTDPINVVSVYRKTLETGEQLSFGKWVLLLGPHLSCKRTLPKPWIENQGELLYNGIRLPKAWPPRYLDPKSREPMPVPYLESPPKVISIDVGRQLFVDDFLIESTTMTREFHKAEKYEHNPVLKPETELELSGGQNPIACPFSDGVFYDPQDRLFKMWYHAGWFDGTAYVTSKDGIHWTRPSLDIEPGTNRVLEAKDNVYRDGVSVWLDQETDKPEEHFKMFLFTRSPGEAISWDGHLLTSPDGIHFTQRTLTGPLGDNTTFFYNPFRKKWVLSIRSWHNMRQRDYWENSDFLAANNRSWGSQPPVFWCGADKLDKPDPKIQAPTQLYKVDAVAYESVMLGLMQIHYGPPNEICEKEKYPKLTELEVAFSRDGFHWDRTCRETFINASKKPGDWERGYIHSAGGCCLVVGDKLYFYYGAFSGQSPRNGGGIYAGAATGLAFLRRDGFASMNATESPATLTTRPVQFSGNHMFANLDAPEGSLRVEALDEIGTPIEPFTLENCEPVTGDKTLLPVRWRSVKDLSTLSKKPVRFRFELKNAKLYAFWVSPDGKGASYGYVAAGGPGFTGPTDTIGDRKN